MKMKKNRIDYIDIARGLAIMLIVVGHIINKSMHTSLLIKIIYSFHVALFFLISGYLFNSNKKITEFAKNKFIRLMIPYFFWSVVFLIPYYIFGRDVGGQLGISSSYDIKTILYNIVYGNGNSSALRQNSALWFLPALFTTEIFFYFLINLFKESKKYILFFICIVIGILSQTYLKIYLPWGINSFLNIGVYFMVGNIFKDINISKFSNIKISFIAFFTLFFGLIAAFFNTETINCIEYSYGNIYLAYISGTLLSIFFILISYKISKNKILSYIGKNTMSILIFHKLIILVFQTKLGIISKLLINSNFYVEFIIGIIVMFITIIVSIVIGKTIKKYFPILIG